MKRKKKDYLENSKRMIDMILIQGQIWTLFIFLLFFLNIIDIKTTLIFLLLTLLIIIILFYNQKINMIQYKLSNIENTCDDSSYENYKHNDDIVENFEFNVRDTEALNEENPHWKPHKARINYHCLSDDYKPSYYDNSTLIHLTEDIKNNEKIYNYDKIKQNKLGNPNFLTKTLNQSLAGAPNPKTQVPPIIAPRSLDLEYWRMNDDIIAPEIINAEKQRFNIDSGYNVTFVPDEADYSTPIDYGCTIRKKKKTKKTNQPNVSFKKSNYGNNYDIIENFPYETNDGKNSSEMADKERILLNRPFNTNYMFKDIYNPNVYTETITPGTYHINDRNEPINSLMGVTYPQQFQESNYEVIEPPESVNMSNTYDPRFYGYGTSYRSYVDDLVGQPRFYYDDVNAVKMPNYLCRNKIDVTPFGDRYGALEQHNPHTPNIHNLANQHYTDSMINFRTEMQERLMRKRNSESWQQRLYPISKSNQRMLK